MKSPITLVVPAYAGIQLVFNRMLDSLPSPAFARATRNNNIQKAFP